MSKLLGFWESGDFGGIHPADDVDFEWNIAERHAVSLYLMAGEDFRTGNSGSCLICGSEIQTNHLTDGTWVWPSGFSHYVGSHSVKPKKEFLDKIFAGDSGQQLIATAASKEFNRQFPKFAAYPAVIDGRPIVVVLIPKRVLAHHIPSGILGVKIIVKREEDGAPMVSSGMTPESISSILVKIADSIDSSENPSRKILSSRLRVLLALVEDDVVLTFQPKSGSVPSDEGTRDSVNVEFMQAGAKNVEWDKDSFHVVAPPGSKVSVLQAFNDMKSGEMGEDLKSSLGTVDYAGPDEIPAKSIAEKVASRIARGYVRRTSKPVITHDMIAPHTEYSCQVDISLIADFEGSIAKQKLLKKLRTELIAAIQEGVSTTAREYALEATGVQVKPIKIDCALNDIGSPEDEEDPDFEV